MATSPSANRDKIFQYGLFCDEATDPCTTDVTDQCTLISLTVRKAINRIGKATLVLDAGEKPDGSFPDSDTSPFKPGKKIKLTAGYETIKGEKDASALDVLFEGNIISHRLSINNRQRARVIIECRDFAYPATLGRKNKIFEEAKDGDTIAKVLKGHGLSVSADPTSVEYPQLIQYYSTDWDFALSRADANGLVIITEGSQTTVKKPKVSQGAALTVEYGKDLIEFDGSLSTSDQYAATQSIAWEISTQALVKAIAEEPSLNNQGDISATTLAEAGGDTFLYQTSASIGQDALQAWADAQALKNGLSRFQGSLLFDGNAQAKPGCIIELKGMGAHFNGNAYISAVEHTLKQGEWLTKAEMGLSPENSIDPSDVTAPPASGLLPAIEGIQVGKVKDISDEKDSEHFIQVELPLFDDSKKTVWARPATYYASNGVGNFFLPEKNDEVVLGFINNDPCFPVILGSLYSRTLKPPLTVDKENKQKTLVTKGKNKIVFDDDKLSIMIQTPGENQVLLDDDGKKIVFKDQNNNTITMEKSGITIESAKDLILKAKGNVKINATQNFETESKSDTKISGLNVNATAKVGVKLNGSATAELSASGQTTVKGAMVMIN